MASKVFIKKKSTIDSVDKSAAKMNLTTSSANIIQGMTDEGEHLVLITIQLYSLEENGTAIDTFSLIFIHGFGTGFG